LAELAKSPALLAEARDCRAALEARAFDCGPERVMATLTPLFAVFPQPNRSEAEWTAWWSAYLEDLSDIPVEALKAAVVEYRRKADAEFFPKPGPLRALALEAGRPLLTALSRARRAERIEPPKPILQPVTPELAAETVAAVNKHLGGAKIGDDFASRMVRTSTSEGHD
jgi:hypothetical protein